MDKEFVQTDQGYQSKRLSTDLDISTICEDLDHFSKRSYLNKLPPLQKICHCEFQQCLVEAFRYVVPKNNFPGSPSIHEASSNALFTSSNISFFLEQHRNFFWIHWQTTVHDAKSAEKYLLTVLTFIISCGCVSRCHPISPEGFNMANTVTWRSYRVHKKQRYLTEWRTKFEDGYSILVL